MTIEKVLHEFFKKYQKHKDTNKIKYVITKNYRVGNMLADTNSIVCYAVDISLRYNDDYAPFFVYYDFMEYIIEHWPYKAGMIEENKIFRIYLDLGIVNNDKKLPYFFKKINNEEKQITNLRGLPC